MIITIDGPTASGKSSTARSLAQQLGFFYINSGFLYRGLAWIALKHVAIDKLSELSMDYIISLREQLIYRDSGKNAVLLCNEENIALSLKNPIIDKASSLLGTNQNARAAVFDWQKMLAMQHSNCVVEGRDAGTIVFPDADYKFFLTARLEIRAGRWLEDQQSKGVQITADTALKALKERDDRDSRRTIAPLRIPESAVIIDNSDMSIVQTVEAIKKMLPLFDR